MSSTKSLEITSVRHAWPEKTPGFKIDRPLGYGSFVLIHLWQSVDMTLKGKSFVTSPNAFMIYSPSEPQLWSTLPGGIIHDWIHIEGDVEAALKDAGIEANRIYYPKNPSFITSIVAELEMEFFAEKIHGKEIVDLKLRELFYKIARSSLTDASSSHADEETVIRLKALRSEIFSNLRDCPDVGDMAKMLSISQSKLYVIYKDTFGISPTKDIINARIENAKIYLSSGAFSVEQTAELVGYKSAFHFIRQFKQETGITPGKYASWRR